MPTAPEGMKSNPVAESHGQSEPGMIIAKIVVAVSNRCKFKDRVSKGRGGDRIYNGRSRLILCGSGGGS